MKLKISADLNEALVEHHHPHDERGESKPDPAVAVLAAAVKTARESAERLAAAAEAIAADRTMTPEARAIRLRDNALKLAEATAARLDTAQASVRAELAQIETTLRTPPAPDPATAPLESEIRARLASMNDKDRQAAINTAFSERNGLLVGAVLRGPAFLSGMSRATYDMAVHRYGQTFHPEQHQRRARLQAALDAAERCGRSFLGFVSPAIASEAARLADAADRARGAEEALRADISN